MFAFLHKTETHKEKNPTHILPYLYRTTLYGLLSIVSLMS